MIFFYRIFINLILILSPIIILVRLLRNKEDFKRFKEKIGFFKKDKKKGKLIWFHGASVGEVLSVIPVIKKYEKDKSIKQILITSSTLSSSKVLLKFKFKKTIHQFYPLDHFLFTQRFLKFWKPDIAIFIESEIWPCMFKSIKKYEIPLVLLNARITKKTFIRWMKIKKFSKSIFNKISIAYPQNLETKKFLEKLKVKKINIIGNLKYAETDSENQDIINHQLKSRFKNKKIWIASSTHSNEEVFCAKAHIELKKKFKNLITIIIPRHVHRAKKIIPEIKNLKLEVIRHSSKNINLKDTDIYLVDTFGETKKFHQIGNTVFLGGSIIKRGGQNPLEATRLGAKILHGPNTDNFKDVYKFLKKIKVSKKINTPKQLASSIIFKKNKNTGTKIKNIGEKILKKTIKELDYLIKNEFKKT